MIHQTSATQITNGLRQGIQKSMAKILAQPLSPSAWDPPKAPTVNLSHLTLLRKDRPIFPSYQAWKSCEGWTCHGHLNRVVYIQNPKAPSGLHLICAHGRFDAWSATMLSCGSFTSLPCPREQTTTYQLIYPKPLRPACAMGATMATEPLPAALASPSRENGGYARWWPVSGRPVYIYYIYIYTWYMYKSSKLSL